jgi:hypothetical protein
MPLMINGAKQGMEAYTVAHQALNIFVKLFSQKYDVIIIIIIVPHYQSI